MSNQKKRGNSYEKSYCNHLVAFHSPCLSPVTMRRFLAFVSAACILLVAAALPVSAYRETGSHTRTVFSQKGGGIRTYRIEFFFNGEDHSAWGQFTVDVSGGTFDSRGETFHASFDVFAPITSENYVIDGHTPPPQDFKSLPPENSVNSLTADPGSSHFEIFSKTSEYSVQLHSANTVQCLWQIDADGDYNSFCRRVGSYTSP